jgi:Flp pilus assembly pilin Flp
MQATIIKTERRRQDRMQAVLPVRVRGTDASGAMFEALAHTLDLTPTGARLGAIRHPLKVLDTLTIFYHQRRMEFTVVWTRLLDGRQEYQVGLQAFSQEKDPWGMNSFTSSVQLARQAQVSGAAWIEEKSMNYFQKTFWSNDVWSNEEGQDVAEYSIMLAVILVIVVGTVRLIGSNAGNVFSQVGSTISNQ